MSPTPFNIYSENIMREATENVESGISIGGRGFELGGQQLKEVEDFVYLGSIINKENEVMQEVKRMR